MVPHIVFHPQRADYRPGPEVWGSDACDGAPTVVATSGITQPPVLATAVRVVHEAAPDRAFLEEVLPALEAWHVWFHRERAVDGSALVAILHPWESADNAPRFDRALARIDVDGVDPVERTDQLQIDAAERPTDLDYRRYFALVAWLRGRPAIGPASPPTAPFAYVDLPLNSILVRRRGRPRVPCRRRSARIRVARAHGCGAAAGALAATWDEEAGATANGICTGGRV